jgi:hypothetical protein
LWYALKFTVRLDRPEIAWPHCLSSSKIAKNLKRLDNADLDNGKFASPVPASLHHVIPILELHDRTRRGGRNPFLPARGGRWPALWSVRSIRPGTVICFPLT